MRKHDVGFIFCILSFILMIPMFIMMFLFIATGQTIYMWVEHSFAVLALFSSLAGVAIEFYDYHRLRKGRKEESPSGND